MKREFVINITMDDETGFIEEMDMTEGIYNRTEFAASPLDKPYSIRQAMRDLSDELNMYI